MRSALPSLARAAWRFIAYCSKDCQVQALSGPQDPLKGVSDLQEGPGAGGDEEETLVEEEDTRTQGGQRGGSRHEPSLRRVRRGVFRDVQELHEHPLLLSCMAARALVGPQASLQRFLDLPGEPGVGIAEEEARGARTGAGGGPRRDAESRERRRLPLERTWRQVQGSRGVLVAALSRDASGLWGRGSSRQLFAHVCVNNLGMLLQDQGKFSLAEPFLRRALEGCERTMGRDHPYTLRSVINVRVLLKAMEREN